MKFTVHPLTPERLPALDDLFHTQGPVSRCWCMYWRIGDAYRKRSPKANRAEFSQLVPGGEPLGLLAFNGDLCVGWCQLTPRDALPWMDKTWRLKRVDELPVWSLSCFYIRKGWRRKGVTSALIGAAIKATKKAGARAGSVSARCQINTEQFKHRLRLHLQANRVQDRCASCGSASDHAV